MVILLGTSKSVTDYNIFRCAVSCNVGAYPTHTNRSRTSPSPLACAAQEAKSLCAYWQTLTLQRRRNLLKDLPEAAALVSNPRDGVGGSRRGLVQDLVLAPVAWCFEVCVATETMLYVLFPSLRVTRIVRLSYEVRRVFPVGMW